MKAVLEGLPNFTMEDYPEKNMYDAVDKKLSYQLSFLGVKWKHLVPLLGYCFVLTLFSIFGANFCDVPLVIQHHAELSNVHFTSLACMVAIISSAISLAVKIFCLFSIKDDGGYFHQLMNFYLSCLVIHIIVGVTMSSYFWQSSILSNEICVDVMG